MGEPALYNSRIIKAFVEYLAKFHTEVDIPALLSASGIESYELEDEGHWLTQRQVDAFNDALMAQTNDPSLPRNAGRYMTNANSMSAVRQFLLTFVTPMQAYLRMPRTASYLNRATLFKPKKLSSNKVEISVDILKDVQEMPYQCENRIGSFEAIAKFFTGRLPTVEHNACLHKGDKRCVYVISWDEPAYLKLRRFRNYLAVLLIPGLIVFLFTLSHVKLVNLAVVSAVILTGISYYVLWAENRQLSEKIGQDGETANRLLDQIAESYDNSLLVQEIGRAVSDELDMEKFFEIVSETLKKGLNFDRGMIMLANSDRTKLVYTTGYGYEPEMENVLKNAAFHLDNPDSHGAFYKSFTSQTPFLVNNINDIKHELSPRAREFAEKLGTKSFICVPIIYEGVSEGILSVDNCKSSHPLGQTGVNVLMGIATQIAISLNNARNYLKLKRSEECFRTLNENSPDIIYTIDNRGTIDYMNPSLEDHLGYLPENIIGKNFFNLVRNDDVPVFTTFFNRIINKMETVRHFQGYLLSRSGDERLFDMSGAPNINYMGEMVGVVGVLKDITEQARLEEQLRHTSKMNALGQLTGGIAHDFNNILQAISSYAELMKRKNEEENLEDRYLLGIQELTDRGTDLVRQLMMFSRKAESSFVPLDLNREINTLTELLQETFPKNIEIRCVLEDHLKPVLGDAVQMHQVILNLAVNARDAMPDGGILKIETHNVFYDQEQTCCLTTIGPGHYAVMRVSDTGSGIDKKTLEHIFEPFFTTKGVGRGTGIGLAVVYGVTKNHGGYISCRSEVEKGTEFTLYFPTVDERSVVREKGERAGKENRGRGETVLLVDDEKTLLETGMELLSMSGFSVLTASSGEEALEMLKKEGGSVDVAIMDIMMPGMGGVQCLHEALKMFPKMKVIMASGFVESDKKERILQSGAAAFIQKPYKIDDLNQKIRAVMASSPGT